MRLLVCDGELWWSLDPRAGELCEIVTMESRPRSLRWKGGVRTESTTFAPKVSAKGPDEYEVVEISEEKALGSDLRAKAGSVVGGATAASWLGSCDSWAC